ncbi:MAG: Beta-ketoacyl synthase [Pedosphaera sp.]|nr:Beta-ketoacyl synthase [Pedosphaera sp.]
MSGNSQRVVITGTGAVSALGGTTDELWEGLLAARCGVRCLPRFVTAGLSVTTGGEVDAAPHHQTDRDEVMASLAIEGALSSAALKAEAVGFIWATGLDTFQIGVKGLEYRSAGSCFNALAQKFRGPQRMIATACASGTQAIGEAFRLVKSGRAEAIVAGGSSAMLTPFYLIGFAGLQAIAVDEAGGDPTAACRPFDRQRRGFALGDGAGAVMVETLASAQLRGATPLAEIVGFGMSQDAFDLNRPSDDGVGAELCMRRTLQDAGLVPDDVQAVNAHGTGTFAGDLAEAAALRRIFGEAGVPVSSVKGAIGHAMAAAGALEAIVALKTCATGIVPPTVNLNEPGEGCELDHVIGKPRQVDARAVLSVSFGMGGQNAAIILRRMLD